MSKRNVFGFCIVLFALLETVACGFLLYRKFHETQSGSCCLPKECDVMKMPVSRAVGTLARGFHFCNITQEEATLMGCPQAYAALHSNCTLTNSQLCNTDYTKMVVLGGTISILVGALFLLPMGCLLLCHREERHGRDIARCPLVFSGILCVLAMTAAIVGLVFSSILTNMIDHGTYSEHTASKCVRSTHSKKHSHCIEYEYAIFDFDNGACPYAYQHANLMSWILHREKLLTLSAALVAAPAVHLLVIIVTFTILICRKCGNCKCCDDDRDSFSYGEFSSTKPATGTVVNYGGAANEAKDTDHIYQTQAEKLIQQNDMYYGSSNGNHKSTAINGGIKY